MSIHVNLEDPDNAFEFADFIELDLLYSEEVSSSRAEIFGASGTLEVSDSQVEFALSEVSRRQARLGAIYPFKVESDLVIRRLPQASEVRLYEFLLLCSASGTEFRVSRSYSRPDQIFDEIISSAMCALLGAGSESVVFAHPALNDFSSSTDFHGRVDDLAKRIGVGAHGVTTPDFLNDGGVDVVSWRRFGDPHLGFPLVLTQNTIRNRYVDKRHDVSLLEWAKFLPEAGAMIQGLAIPHLVDANTANLVGIGSHVLLDRMRICELLGPPPLIDERLAAHTDGFLAAQLERVEGYISDGTVRPKRQRRAKK